MKTRISVGLGLGIGLLAGFGLGRFLQPADPQPGTAGKEAATAKLSPGPRISVPVSSVVKTLQDAEPRQLPGFSLRGFEDLSRCMPKALAFIGIAHESQPPVIRLFWDIEQRMLAEEKQRLKVSKATDTEIVIDHSAMLEPAKQFANEARQGLIDHLPPEFAEALIQAIDWDGFYMQGDGAPLTTFQIVRGKHGLMARRSFPKGSTAIVLKSDRYKDDGSLIAAKEVYGDARWKGHLGDRKLLPVDDPDLAPKQPEAPVQKVDNE